MAYKRQDRNRGQKFDLTVDYILGLKSDQQHRCAACNIEMLWAHQPKDAQHYSVDRLDNGKGHCQGNVRLTCLECNRK